MFENCKQETNFTFEEEFETHFLINNTQNRKQLNEKLAKMSTIQIDITRFLAIMNSLQN